MGIVNYMLIGMLFSTYFLSHHYMSTSCIQATIVPLMKCKGKELSDINNYCAITVSNDVTKLLECLLINKTKMFTDKDWLYSLA